jgi:hypothetical protein
MTTLSGFPLCLDPDEFVESYGEALRRPAMHDSARQGLAAARDLISPAVAYGWFSVGERARRTAEVGGVTFTLGRHADLLGPAELVFVAVVTIGLSLEERSRELQAGGKALESFMLDAAGVYAVATLIKMAHSLAEEGAAERGWGVGAELAPGQLSGWEIGEQKLVVSLLDIEAIGVRVTDSGMLVPQKSASVMVGLGPGYESSEVHSPCTFCDLRETCKHKH